MTSAELIAKIKAEINYRIEIYLGNAHACVGTTIIDGLEEVLNFLSTLESEKPMNQEGLDEEYKDYVERDPVYSKLVNRNAGLDIARHFAKWGAEQSGSSEIPNNHEGLDEYASRAGVDYVDKIEQECPGHRWNDHDVEFAYRDGMIAGAEWAFGQGLVYEGEVRHHGESGDTVYVEHPSTLRKKYAKMFKNGEKVIVQIRKK